MFHLFHSPPLGLRRGYRRIPSKSRHKSLFSHRLALRPIPQLVPMIPWRKPLQVMVISTGNAATVVSGCHVQRNQRNESNPHPQARRNRLSPPWHDVDGILAAARRRGSSLRAVQPATFRATVSTLNGNRGIRQHNRHGVRGRQ